MTPYGWPARYEAHQRKQRLFDLDLLTFAGKKKTPTLNDWNLRDGKVIVNSIRQEACQEL
jgi:hypothetical protein